MKIRSIQKHNGEVSVNEGGRDKTYVLRGGAFTVSYAIDRTNKNGRKVQMHRTLDPQSAKAAAIRAILESA